MKKIIICIVLFFSQCAEKPSEQLLMVSQHNFGRTKKNSAYSYTIEAQNVGTKPVIIKNIISGCGCTAVLPSSTEIKPHQTIQISLKFNTAGLEGHVEKQIQIFTNDAVNSVKTIMILADIEK